MTSSKYFLIPDLTLALLKGSATHDLVKRHAISIYLKTKSDKNAFYDKSTSDQTKYEMLKNGYAFIRPFDEIQSMMKTYKCKIVFPAKGLIFI